MTDPLHVAPGIVGILDAPNHVRIRAIRTERWIGFGRARRVVEHLSALCEYPPSTRPPGLAIYGHSGMGKTMLVEKFRRDHPPAFNSAVGFETSPVLAISLTSRPTERRVYAQLLMALGVSVNERATLLELEIKAIRLLKDSMVRVLVFDEVHNLLAGSPREQRVILQLFRHLSNELKASLVCLGVADARDAIAGDVQLARRLDQLVLPRWKGDEEFQEMVTAILRSLPLKRPSVLSAQGLRHLVRLADGITARVFGVLNELAIDAVQLAPSAFQTPSSKPGSPQSKRRLLSPDGAIKLALKLRLNDAPVSISVPILTQIVPVSGSSVNRQQGSAECPIGGIDNRVSVSFTSPTLRDLIAKKIRGILAGILFTHAVMLIRSTSRNTVRQVLVHRDKFGHLRRVAPHTCINQRLLPQLQVVVHVLVVRVVRQCLGDFRWRRPAQGLL